MRDRKEVIPDLDSIALTLLDAEVEAVMLVDLNGIILFVNSSAAQRFGKSVDEMIGNCVWDVYASGIKNQHKILVNQALQTGQPITVRQKDNEHWNQTVFYPIQVKDNQVKSIALFISDITAQVMAEERLKQALIELVTVQDDERHRISQDLHDDVGQKMTALIFELRAIKDSVENNQKVSCEEINTLIRHMELIIKHVRQVFYQLSPPSLTRVALPKVLAGFCGTFEETNNVHIDFSCQDEFPELPDNYVFAIYWFVQEGLTNILKHAKASAAWINLDYIEDDLNISVEDNGLGFNLKMNHEGIGLQGIRKRFTMLGGNVEIESSPGMGTRLSGTIPFNTSNL